MTNKNDPPRDFKIICKPLGMILIVKSFSQLEQYKLYEDIRQRLKDAVEPLSIVEYKKLVIETF